MSTQPVTKFGPVGHAPGQWEQRRSLPAEPQSRSVDVPGWAIAGLAAAAVGLWAWYAFGPDVQRYLKIRSM